MLKVSLSRLLAVALNMHLTLHLLLFEQQSIRVLIVRRMKYLISIKRKIYLIVLQDKELLCLCFAFKIIVCKDDDVSVLTAIRFINENIEKCTMIYRVATRNGIECCNIWVVTTIFDRMGLNCYI